MNVLENIKKNKLMPAVGMMYIVLLIFFPDYGIKALKNSSYYLIEMLQVLPVIFVLTVVIEAWVPKEVIVKMLGDKSGVSGNVISLIFGSISAGPVYAAFPVTKMLLKKGASVANVVIILSAWAVIKVPMLINEVKFLGVDFMIIRWILTVIAIFIMGYLISLIIKPEELTNSKDKDKSKVVFEIKDSYCVGCGICAKSFPEFYEMVGNKAKIKLLPLGKEKIEAVKLSVKSCPTKAIEFQDERSA